MDMESSAQTIYHPTASAFLSELMAKEKRVNGTSLRALASQSDCSPALLSLILNGRRKLTLGAAKRLADALTLHGRQREYFLTLAERDTSKTRKERANAEAKLLALKSEVESNPLPLTQYKFLSTWYYPVIYVLVGLKCFRRDPLWIAEVLGGRITAADAEQTLRDLLELGLVEMRDDKLVQKAGAVATKEDIRNTAVYQYHRNALERAHEALDLPIESRELNGLTVGIPKDKFHQVRARIHSFTKELNEFLSQFDESERVYQMNIQLFPVTEEIESAPKNTVSKISN